MTAVLLETGSSETLPDTQASEDRRGLAIDAAGVRGVRLPLRIADVDGTTRETVVVADASVAVAARHKGTHMSRLVEHLHAMAPTLSLADLVPAAADMARRLDAPSARLLLRFPWFVAKQAPVSRIESWLDVEMRYEISTQRDAGARLQQQIAVPVTSLCPCSKYISRHGAHNQRSTVTARFQIDRPKPIAALVALIEGCASCAVFGILKRSDEKFVTEAAYENPKFAEDIARDVYSQLASDTGVQALSVVSEKQESIHNHAAYAFIGSQAGTASDPTSD